MQFEHVSPRAEAPPEAHVSRPISITVFGAQCPLTDLGYHEVKLLGAGEFVASSVSWFHQGHTHTHIQTPSVLQFPYFKLLLSNRINQTECPHGLDRLTKIPCASSQNYQ